LIYRCSVLALLALGSMLGACDGSAANVPVDAGPGDASLPLADAYVAPDAWTFSIAPHGPGLVVQSQGGTTFTHPQLVVITFSDDPNRAQIEAHASWLVTSNWLTTVGAEYGVGTGTVLANVRRTDAAPDATTTSDIEALLAAGIADHSLPHAADGTFRDVLYVIYYPEHTHISDSSLGDSCVSYGGYHSEVANGGTPFSYAVIPNCPNFEPPLSAFQFEQLAMTHEVFEAATDARPASAPAYVLSPGLLSFSPWLLVGAELADFCALRVSEHSYVMEAGFYATRVWSNAAAASNDRDPCVPVPSAAPAYRALSITPTDAQAVAAGGSVTFSIDAWTTSPMPAFRVFAQPASPTPPPGMFEPVLSLDRMTMNNGDHATLTVSAPVGTPHNAYALIYVETAVSASDYDATPVAVYVQ